jgi:thioredoxin 1
MDKNFEVNEQTFQEMLQKAERPIVADFYATWCVPCQMLDPIIKDLAKKYKGQIDICKIDIEASPNLVTLFSIMSVPTILFYKGTKVVDQITGMVEKDDIVKKLEKLLQ